MTFFFSLYWKCQLIGWSVAATANFLLQMLRPDANALEQLGTNLCFAALGISCTHGLRLGYRKLHIADMAIVRMILPVLGLSLLSAVILIISMFSLLSLTITEPAALFNVNVALGNLIGIYPLILIWSCLYLGSQYLRRWRQSEVEKLELANALKDAQLNTLIGQINPHFMFNALNNIRALMLEDVPRARDSLTLLAKVLRYGLTAPQHNLVSLQDELNTVNDFVELALIQYEHRLQWQPQIDVSPAQYSVPPMLIQMLIENAIKHGIALRKDGGKLQLLVQRQAQFLLIRVSNPGKLAQQPRSETSTQLGLNNIAQRLRLLYNDNARFTLQQQDDNVIATLHLPLSDKEKV